MTPNPRFHWWTSLALLVIGGALTAVFLGPQKNLAVVPQAPGDRSLSGPAAFFFSSHLTHTAWMRSI